MALKIMVSREVGGAVGAFVALRRRRFGGVLAIARQAHLASWGAWVGFWRPRTRERERATAWVVTRVWRNQLVMVLRVVWWLLGRAFLRCGPNRGCRCFNGRNTGRRGRIAIAKAGEADWTCLHVFARDAGVFRDDEWLCCLVDVCAHLCWPLRGV